MMSTPATLQSKANPQQLEAILATDGPVLIIAGPGSGKTFTLVERIVYLITHKGVAPESLPREWRRPRSFLRLWNDDSCRTEAQTNMDRHRHHSLSNLSDR